MSQTASLEQARANSLAKLASFFVFLFAFFGGASTLGINVKAVLTFSGATGVVIGLAGRDMLANFIGGVTIYLSQPFTVGDWVHNVPNDQFSRPTLDGWVEQIGWYYTKINTWDKRPMYIPNAQFHSMVIINASRMSNRRILHTLRLRLQDRARLPVIIGEIKAALMANPNLDIRQHRLVYWRSIGEYSLDLWLSCFTRSVYLVDFLNVQQDILFEIDSILDANGARFASNLAREQQIVGIGGTDTSRLIGAAATGARSSARARTLTPAKGLIDTKARTPPTSAVLPNAPMQPEGNTWVEAEAPVARKRLGTKGAAGAKEKETASSSSAAAASLNVGGIIRPETLKRRAAAAETPAAATPGLTADKDFVTAMAAEVGQEAEKLLERKSEEEAAAEEAIVKSEAPIGTTDATAMAKGWQKEDLEARQDMIALREAALKDQEAAATAREVALQAQAQALKEQESASRAAKKALQQRLSALEGREAAIIGDLERAADELVGQKEAHANVETRNTTEMREEAAKQQEASLRLMEAANLYKERSVARKEDAVDAKAQALEQRERSLQAMQEAIDLEKKQVSELKEQVRDEVMGVVQAVVSAATIDNETAATAAASAEANAAAAAAAELRLAEEEDEGVYKAATDLLALAEEGTVADEVVAALASLQEELRPENPDAGGKQGVDQALLDETDAYKGDGDDTVYIEEYERTQMGD